MILLWLLRRLLLGALLALAVACVVFLVLHVQETPLDLLISSDADATTRAQTAAALGLDQPLIAQFVLFLRGLLNGTLGRSFIYNEPAFRVALGRMPATLELAIPAALLAVVIGLPLGIRAGRRPNSLLGFIVRTAAMLGRSLPAFWLGLMLIALFALRLNLLPSDGRGALVVIDGVSWSFTTLDGLAHLVLPVASLAVGNIALVLALGWRLSRDTTDHAHAGLLRGVLAPVLMAVALELGSTIAGAMVTENIFAWPGIGKLLIDSFNVLDRPTILAIVVVVVVVIATLNLLVEFIARLLGPSASPERPAERFFTSPTAVIALVVLLGMVGIAVEAGQIAVQNPYDPASFNIADASLGLHALSADGKILWLGTDSQGHDVLSGIVYGVRLSLLIAAGSILVAVLFGTALGGAAAIAGGAVEALIAWIGAVQLALPPILVTLLLLAFTTRRISHVVLAMVLVLWPRHAIITHIGIHEWRGWERLRRVLALFGVEAMVQMSRVIALEATLSFLGLGMPITTPSLGVLIASGTSEMLAGHFGPVFWPGAVLFVLLLSINLVASRLRRCASHPALG